MKRNGDPLEKTPGKHLSCSVTRIAPAARDWLASSAPARPYHIFEKVCNLINTEGEVLTLMLPPAEMNPLALELDCVNEQGDLTQAIFPDSMIYLEGDSLRVGEVTIQLRSQTVWDPVPRWDSARQNRQNVEKTLGEVASLLSARRSPDSLAVFVTKTRDLSNSAVEGWQSRAREPILRLLGGLKDADDQRVNSGARELAGLGPGLTPGGDDFVIGVMHALWCATTPEQARMLCGELLRAVANKTNRLSASYLARAAYGEAGDTWHTLIRAMARGDASTIVTPVESLIGLGHTSGQDALSGFMLAFGYVHSP
jgi:hypothetical protein